MDLAKIRGGQPLSKANIHQKLPPVYPRYEEYEVFRYAENPHKDVKYGVSTQGSYGITINLRAEKLRRAKEEQKYRENKAYLSQIKETYLENKRRKELAREEEKRPRKHILPIPKFRLEEKPFQRPAQIESENAVLRADKHGRDFLAKEGEKKQKLLCQEAQVLFDANSGTETKPARHAEYPKLEQLEKIRNREINRNMVYDMVSAKNKEDSFNMFINDSKRIKSGIGAAMHTKEDRETKIPENKTFLSDREAQRKMRNRLAEEEKIREREALIEEEKERQRKMSNEKNNKFQLNQKYLTGNKAFAEEKEQAKMEDGEQRLHLEQSQCLDTDINSYPSPSKLPPLRNNQPPARLAPLEPYREDKHERDFLAKEGEKKQKLLCQEDQVLFDAKSGTETKPARHAEYPNLEQLKKIRNREINSDMVYDMLSAKKKEDSFKTFIDDSKRIKSGIGKYYIGAAMNTEEEKERQEKMSKFQHNQKYLTGNKALAEEKEKAKMEDYRQRLLLEQSQCLDKDIHSYPSPSKLPPLRNNQPPARLVPVEPYREDKHGRDFLAKEGEKKQKLLCQEAQVLFDANSGTETKPARHAEYPKLEQLEKIRNREINRNMVYDMLSAQNKEDSFNTFINDSKRIKSGIGKFCIGAAVKKEADRETKIQENKTFLSDREAQKKMRNRLAEEEKIREREALIEEEKERQRKMSNEKKNKFQFNQKYLTGNKAFAEEKEQAKMEDYRRRLLLEQCHCLDTDNNSYPKPSKLPPLRNNQPPTRLAPLEPYREDKHERDFLAKEGEKKQKLLCQEAQVLFDAISGTKTKPGCHAEYPNLEQLKKITNREINSDMVYDMVSAQNKEDSFNTFINDSKRIKSGIGKYYIGAAMNTEEEKERQEKMSKFQHNPTYFTENKALAEEKEQAKKEDHRRRLYLEQCHCLDTDNRSYPKPSRLLPLRNHQSPTRLAPLGPLEGKKSFLPKI